MNEEPTKISILEHLRELRRRVIYSVIGIMVGVALAFWWYPNLIKMLQKPASNVGGVTFIYSGVTEGFSVSMRVSFVAGIALAMPVIMYNVLMFIIPALNMRERRLVFVALPFILAMFVLGIWFGYRYLIPPALGFLLTFGAQTASGEQIATYLVNLGDYVNFITRLLLVIGLIFEMPVVATFLARIGILTAKWMINKWKWVIVGAFVVSSIVTPTPDAINQTLVAGVLIGLYGVSTVMAWLAQMSRGKARQQAEVAQSSGSGSA
jgi:sec-independent protein translocase protein TatC